MVARHPAMEEAGSGGADDRHYPEQPQLLQSPATDKDRLTGTTSWINRGIGDRDADQVNQRQAQANGNRRKPEMWPMA